MRKLLLTISLFVASMSVADELFYHRATGKILSRDKTVDASLAGDQWSAWVDFGYTTNTVGLASTTNNLNIVPPITNISQIVIVPIDPQEHLTDFSAQFDRLLKAFALVVRDNDEKWRACFRQLAIDIPAARTAIEKVCTTNDLTAKSIEDWKTAVRTKYKEMP